MSSSWYKYSSVIRRVTSLTGWQPCGLVGGAWLQPAQPATEIRNPPIYAIT